MENKKTKEQVFGAFIKLDSNTFGNGKTRTLARILETSPTNLDRWRKEKHPASGKNWDQIRTAMYSEISTNVQKSIVETQSEIKIKLIKKDLEVLKIMSDEMEAYFKSKQFKITNINDFKIVMDAIDKTKTRMAKMLQLTGEGGSSGPTFNINVPRKGLNAWGRQWVMNQMDNPSNAIDADYEIVRDDEESMQRKLLNETKPKTKET